MISRACDHSGLRGVLTLAAALGPAVAQAQSADFEVRGRLEPYCALTFDCGGDDRCNDLRLSDRNNAQDIVEISVDCNFTGSNVSLEVSSLNNGALRATRDTLPLEYEVSLNGIAGADFSDRQLAVPIRVPVRVATAGTRQSAMMRVRLQQRPEMLAADRYSDQITITIVPDPS